MMGIFTEWQSKYAAVGIATVPIDPEKKLFRGPWNKIGFPGSTELTRNAKYQGCNGIGFVCGPRNGITDLDVDAPDRGLLQEALERHGDSPIIVETASGKFKIWYRHNGERRSVRKLAREVWGRDVPIDILGSGLSVAPPTTNSKGQYRFIRGSLEDVARLPVMRGLPSQEIVLPDDVDVLEEVAPEDVPLQPVIKEGRRDIDLWEACMRYARTAKTFNDVLAFARDFNLEHMEPPLEDHVAVSKAVSAWKYEERGENWFGGVGTVTVPANVLTDLLLANQDALVLLMVIRQYNWDNETFCVANAMTETMAWDIQRFKVARRALEEGGYLRVIHRGGRGPRDPTIYGWPKKRSVV
jgi:Bifunctional DNA primase/polymerase, N-terminal